MQNIPYMHGRDGRSSVGYSARYTLLCCGFDSRHHTQILYKENRKMLFRAHKKIIKKGSSGGSLVVTPDCKTAVLGSNPAISPAYIGLLS